MARCEECQSRPVSRCARCSTGLCGAHIPVRGRRCKRCEEEWVGEKRTRRALQHMFAPPVFILAGGLTFGILLPVLFALPFTIGATVVAGVATAVGYAAASGTCRLVDSAARAQFLREHQLALPVARVVRLRLRP
jgi:hypothetical protein